MHAVFYAGNYFSLSVGAATKTYHDRNAPDGRSDKPELSPKPSLLHSRERTRDRDKEKEKESSKFAALQKWLKGEEGRHCSERRGSPGRFVSSSYSYYYYFPPIMSF
jgi:hypothetical protein